MSVVNFERLLHQAAPEFLGGYKVDFITLHLDLLRLKTVMKYLKCLVYNLELPSCLYFMEYNLGLQLCSLFNLHCNSRTPHAFSPNQHHGSVLQLIRHHRISLVELTEGCVNLIVFTRESSAR